MIKNILAYQKIDMEKMRLVNSINNSQDKRNLQAMVNYVKEAQNKTLDLDSTANELIKEKQALLNAHEKGANLVNKYTHININDMNYEELKNAEQKLSQMYKQLTELDERLCKHIEKVSKVLSDFDNARKKIVVGKKKHQESKDNYEKLLLENKPKIEELDKKLLVLEKDVEPAMLQKYRVLRRENITPPIVPMINGNCGGCHMSLSLGYQEKLKQKGYLECEQCHRIIYLKE